MAHSDGWFGTEEFEQMILDQCHGTYFQTLFNVDIGHTDQMFSIPMNALASLDSEKDEFCGFAVLQADVAKREIEKGKKLTREEQCVGSYSTRNVL
jgi:hypothetical protein